MEGRAPFTLGKGQPAPGEATGGAGKPRQRFEEAGRKRKLRGLEPACGQDAQGAGQHEPGGQPGKAMRFQPATDCATISQHTANIPQMQNVASTM